jgi:UDP-2,3-diacylglucosamine pyrophosphatase LpxH
MKKYSIYADLHLGHPFAMESKFIFDKNTIFLGDNVDIKNAKKSELKGLIQLRKELIKKCGLAKGIYISGNHSLEPIENRKYLFAVRDNILFTHGDVICWGLTKARLYRSFFSAGKGHVSWVILKYMRRIFPMPFSGLSKKQMESAVNFAKTYNCKTIVMAHFHPKKVIKLKADSIKIIIVPRGRTIITL